MARILEQLHKIHSLLVQNGIDAAIIGGLALGAHGVQRFTNDIDFLVDGAQRLKLKQLMLGNGFTLFAESSEVIQFAGEIPVDVLCANRPVSVALLQQAQLDPHLNIKVISAEGLIGLKIQAYCNDPKRELRDKADIAALVEKNDALDWSTIQVLAEMFDQWHVIEQIRKLHGK
jgi:hypothetical protein